MLEHFLRGQTVLIQEKSEHLTNKEFYSLGNKTL
jgi:Fe-S cluster biosynthesis and repair protein YggX